MYIFQEKKMNPNTKNGMSGGITQLVAVGVQDAYLSGNPEVSFFRSSYKRYTHFASSIERQLVQGSTVNNGVSLVRFEKKGDLLSHVYFTAHNKAIGTTDPTVDWSQIISKVELLIGGQIIDTQDFPYMSNIEPVIGAQTYSSRYIPDNNASKGFYPLKFFFCKDWQSAIPLVALQYHDVELRITWGASIPTDGNGTNYDIICWSRFIYLDNDEREFFAKKSHDMLITQVNRSFVSNTSTIEFALAQPIKCIAFETKNYTDTYKTNPSLAASLKFKIQINGNDIGETRSIYHWTDVNQYYLTPYGYYPNGTFLTTNPSVSYQVSNDRTLFIPTSNVYVGMNMSGLAAYTGGYSFLPIATVNPVTGGTIVTMEKPFTTLPPGPTIPITLTSIGGVTGIALSILPKDPTFTLTGTGVTDLAWYVGMAVTFPNAASAIYNMSSTQTYYISALLSSTTFQITTTRYGTTPLIPDTGGSVAITAVTMNIPAEDNSAVTSVMYNPAVLYTSSVAGLFANAPVTLNGSVYRISNIDTANNSIILSGLTPTLLPPQTITSMTGSTNTTPSVAIVPFCLDTSKLQPTGSLNFSRIDTFRLVMPPTSTFGQMCTGTYFYSINYNILRIQNGMAGILYAS